MATTRALGKYIEEASYLDFPAETVELTKLLLLKTVTGMVVGSREPMGKKIIRHLAQAKGTPEAGLICAGFRTTVENAALAHGIFAHASELEDDQFPGMVGTYWIFPAIFPLAEKLVSDGRELIVAAASCWEVAARLGLAGDPITGMRGYEACTYYGVIGVAAAASKLLGLNTEQVVNAMSLAASHSSGFLCQTGTDGHFIESGHTCRSGILSALMAKEGATGQPDIFERKRGLLDLAGVKVTKDLLNEIVDGLGKPPFNVHKIWIKKYPCCFVMHPSIDALKMLLEEHKLKNENIESVEVEVTEFSYNLCARQPVTLGDARFSFYHALGEVLLRGNVDLSTFILDDKLTDPVLDKARNKIKVINHPEWPMTVPKLTRVTVISKDNKRFTKELPEPIGAPLYPLTSEQIVAIYRQYTDGLLAKGQQDRVAEIVLNLEKQRDILELMDILTFRHVR